MFTAEVNLVMNRLSLMTRRLTKDDIAKFRQKKLDRLPRLKKALREGAGPTAASLDAVPRKSRSRSWRSSIIIRGRM